MYSTKKTILTLGAWVLGAAGSLSLASHSMASPLPPAPQAAAPNAAAKQVVGVIKAISGNSISVTLDQGGSVNVTVQDGAQFLRVEPGQTDLKSAAPMQLSDLQAGDRVLVRGKMSDDSKSLAANRVIAMKHEDVAAKQAKEREDWQKRGIGGLVSAVDTANGTITVSVAAPGSSKAVTIHTAKETVLRRYVPGSVNFDEAKAAPLDVVKPGDQLRARGARNADGSEFAAEEIVSGSFRSISGTVNSVDPAIGVVSVNDLVTKKPVAVKITAQSQIRKLPPALAQGIAARLKGSAAGAPGVGSGAGAAADAPRQGSVQGGAPGAGRAAGGAPADLQQAINRAPAASLSDLQKGDAVMIVSTVSSGSMDVTAITLVGGVEPILQASPSEGMVLSPWNLGGGGGEGEGTP